jgi:hypothetical protein
MTMLGNQTREGTMQTYSHVAVAGQLSFPCSYGVGSSSVSVFQNGVLLSGSDINLTSGNAAVLNVAAAASDEITIQVQDVFSVADTVSATTGGTFGASIRSTKFETTDTTTKTEIFQTNEQTLTTDTTIPSNLNASANSPLTLSATLTVEGNLVII